MNDPWDYKPFAQALERAENFIAVRHAAKQQMDPELREAVLARLLSVPYTDYRSMKN